MNTSTGSGLHPIELTAHTLLNGSFENLNENFNMLNQSQVILLTRLKIIESKLNNFKELIGNNYINEKKLTEKFKKIKSLRKRLEFVLLKLDKIDKRVAKLEEGMD
ncbi:unnamed protein product [Candida verbasci]|uniref:Uncharacterized protein n=1 Tax=Candida verbasci TaxID=1227364 RepID=A0A9W4U085_9ASCO|nr:unnamed protein product [Candida verbasci]